MGIQNKEGALYFATGIDNTGLYQGRREAMGIIKALAGEITSFDVFGGLGVSAALAFAKAAKSSYEFEKQFQKTMKEVATLNSGIKGSLTEWMNQVVQLTRTIPVQANEAAKALYQIISAGYDGAEGMKILEVAAKAAIGGVTDTATAADAITTILNSYKMSADQAQLVSDQLFTTVKLGKTTFGELGQSISQAAPLAASFGINIQDILAAVASLTKQGVPTAQAMTQIRAAISGTANELGDAAFKGRTFQEALQMIYDKAGGSATRMKEMLGTQEAVSATLGVTGNNAKSAAKDLDELGNAAGAAKDAFDTMVDDTSNQMTLLANNITAALRPMGESILKEVSEIATSLNDAFLSGDIEDTMNKLGEMVVIVTGAFVGYKGALVSVTAAKAIHITMTKLLVKARQEEAAALVLNTGLSKAEARAVAKTTAAHALLTTALKAQFVAMAKNAALMMTNPYMLAAAGVAALGYAWYKNVNTLNESEAALKRYNDRQKEAMKLDEERKEKVDKLIDSVRDMALSDLQRVQSLADLRAEYPKIFEKYDIETIKLADILELKRLINEEESNRKVEQREKDLSQLDAEIKRYENLVKSVPQGNDGYVKKLKELRADRDIILQEKGKTISEQFIGNLKDVDVSVIDNYINELERRIKGKGDDFKLKMKLPIDIESNLSDEAIYTVKDIKSLIDTAKTSKATTIETIQNKSTYKEDMEIAKKEWEEAKKALKEIEDAKDKFSTEQYKSAKERSEKAEKAYKDLGGVVSTKMTAKQLQESKIAEEKRAEELLRLKKANLQAEIDLMQEGSEKKIAQINLNYKNEIDAIRKKELEWSSAQNGVLTADQLEQITLAYKNANLKRNTGVLGVNISSEESFNEQLAAEKKAWNEYLIEFGSYQEKRQAIIDKYTLLDKEATTDGERATNVQRMKNELDELDSSVYDSTTLMGQLFADASQKSVNEIQAIIDKAQLLMRYLGSERDDKGTAVIDGKSITKNNILELGISDNTLSNLEKSPEQVQALRNAIKQLLGELGSKSPFLLLKTQIAEAFEKFQKGDVAGGLQGMGSAINQFAPALSQMGQDLGDIFGNDELGNKISGVVDGFAGMATAGAGIGQIMSGDIVGGLMSVVSGVSQVITAFEGLFGADYSHYNKMVEQYKVLNSIWDDLIDKKKQYIEKSYGEEARNIAKEAEALQKLAIESYRILGKERLNSGASAGSHSIGVRQKDKYISNEGWSEALNSLGDEWYNKIREGRMTGLFDLSMEQIEKLKSEAPTFWAQLDTDVRDYLNNIIEGSESLADIQAQVKQQLTQVSFDGVFDDFVSTLLDMDSSAEDFANNFSAYLQKAVLTTMMGNIFRDRLEQWYDSFAQSNEDNDISQDEYQKLQDEYNNIVNDALKEREKLMQAMGWESSRDIDGVTGKLNAAMTEGTASALVGLWNMTATDIRSLLNLSSDHFAECRDGWQRVNEIVGLLGSINTNTENTADNTAATTEALNSLSDRIGEVKNELAEIKRNTKSYNGRG